MKLWEYSGNDVKIIDIDGQVFKGNVDHYTSELDNPDEIASISLSLDNGSAVLINFDATEIASIEHMDVSSRELAIAV